MRGPLSVVFFGCFLNIMGKQLVTPASPIFYIRYVDDTFIRRKKNEENKLFESLNAFHPNIKLTIEENPSKLLDTLLLNNKDGSYSFQVVNKSSKLSFHCSSQVPLQYKRSVIMGVLHRAKANFDFEINRIKLKFFCAGYPLRFMMYQFNKFSVPEEELLIISRFFEERSNVHIKIPFCPKNESVIRKLLDKVESFKSHSIKISYSWLTTKIRTLFPIKDKLTHHHHVIYKVECSCKSTYVGETLRNSNIRWAEHESDKGSFEPAKHPIENPTHRFTWSILDRAPTNVRKRKILEAYHIKAQRPTLNDQLDIKSLILFRFGIT